ncbi:MAG: cobalt ECF transporter T component CbiQ [Candidatus Omnitrophota bacterium]
MKHAYIDEYSGIDSYIRRLEPRIKVIAFFAIIFFVMFTKPTAFITFELYAALMVILILLSKISLWYIFKRSLIIIPFVLMVAVVIPFFKTGEIAGGYSFGTLKLTVTYDGLMVFWNVFVKAYLCILSMILLISSTRFSDLLKAFEKLKCPKLFIMVISFMYRYLFVITDELMQMKQAKEARSVGGTKWFNIRVLANMLGVLFIRSYERGENVYLAMCSRGFDGRVKTITKFQLNTQDFAFLITVICTLIVIFAQQK